jgi:hypothetical protein
MPAISEAGLRVLAHTPRRWHQMTAREHLERALKAADKALVNAHGGDHLAEAAAHLLLALERREHERQGRGEPEDDRALRRLGGARFNA